LRNPLLQVEQVLRKNVQGVARELR